MWFLISVEKWKVIHFATLSPKKIDDGKVLFLPKR